MQICSNKRNIRNTCTAVCHSESCRNFLIIPLASRTQITKISEKPPKNLCKLQIAVHDDTISIIYLFDTEEKKKIYYVVVNQIYSLLLEQMVMISSVFQRALTF